MDNVNIEIKARLDAPDTVRNILLASGAKFIGEDRQIDTYFNVPEGRLKIREGTIENCVVFYRRPDKSGPKRCDYTIEKYARGDTSLQGFKALLTAALGVRTVVDKRREIYFIGNIKFHIDTVDKLGAFFEIEAIGDGNTDVRELENQCGEWLKKLGIDSGSLVDVSYSDMMAGT